MHPVSSTRGDTPHSPAERQMAPRDRRVHEQFAREHAEQAVRTRAALLEHSR